MADPDDEREEELSSNAAIFPELFLDPANRFKASIALAVAPAIPLAVVFTPGKDTDPAQAPAAAPLAREIHRLSNLPPLHLQVALPDGYPADSPPSFDLSTTPKWLPDATLQQLTDRGLALWHEYSKGQVVFAYIDLLQQAAECCFDLAGPEMTGTPIEMAEPLKIPLLNYDMKAKRAKFEQETFDCGVCLEPKRGAACHRLERCGHVFCVACLRDFYTNCIKEGDVSSVKCLDPTCGTTDRRNRSTRTLGAGELLRIPIEHDLVKRYVDMKRKKKLQADKNTVYCPRKWCQGPARSKRYPKVTDLTQLVDSDSEADGEADAAPAAPPMRGLQSGDRLAVCEDCEYAFCRLCLAGWHGEFVYCYPPSAKELSEQEQASYNYLRLHTSQCPTCSSPCQKTHGCNHMCCSQCNTHFCYLCGAWLAPDNPYQHFNTKYTGCYMRLWELEEGDEHHEDGANEPNHRPAAGAGANAAGGRQVHLPGNNAQIDPAQDNRQADDALQRFLVAALADEEDGWNSDDLDGNGDEAWAIPER